MIFKGASGSIRRLVSAFVVAGFIMATGVVPTATSVPGETELPTPTSLITAVSEEPSVESGDLEVPSVDGREQGNLVEPDSELFSPEPLFEFHMPAEPDTAGLEEELRFEVKDVSNAGSGVYSYTLEATVPKEKLEGLDFLTLIRLDDGAEVVLESSKINGDSALAQLGQTPEGKQAIRLALLGYEGEDLEVQILVDSDAPVPAQEWRLATAAEADSADFSIDDDIV